MVLIKHNKRCTTDSKLRMLTQGVTHDIMEYHNESMQETRRSNHKEKAIFKVERNLFPTLRDEQSMFKSMKCRFFQKGSTNVGNVINLISLP